MKEWCPALQTNHMDSAEHFIKMLGLSKDNLRKVEDMDTWGWLINKESVHNMNILVAKKSKNYNDFENIKINGRIAFS